MLKIFMKTAFRNLKKYKTFTFINISGLSLGIAAVLLITMYVLNESSFERVHENDEIIYRVNAQFGMGEQPMKFAGAMPALGQAIKSEIPEVKDFVRFIPAGNIKIKIGEKEFEESKFYYSDASIFNVFTFPLVKGNTGNPFQNNNSVVITESAAKKIFGDENPLGKILNTGSYDFVISAIAKDVPSKTQLQWDFLAPIAILEKSNPNFQSWTQIGGCYTYLLIAKDISTVSLDEKINKIFRANAGQTANYVKLFTEKLTDIYLHSEVTFDISPKGNAIFIYLFSAVAILILVIATFNFMNLSTVRSVQRSKEVGLKKVLGASRSNLIGQFLSESFLITTISVIFSLVLYYAVSPVLSNYLGYKIEVPEFINIYFYLSVAGIILLVSFVSGIYPAFYLSKHKPVDTLKGVGKASPGKLSIRKVLVVFQFALSIILISGTITILQQLNYIKNADIGIDKSNVVLFEFPAAAEGSEYKYMLLKSRLSQDPNILGVSGVYTLPGINSEEQQTISLHQNSQQSNKLIRAIGVDYDFVSIMKIKILSGRNFSQDYAIDGNSSIIINESAAKLLSLKNPVGTTVYIPENNSTKAAKIIGVVNDFKIESLHKKVVPYFLYINPQRFLNVAVKINGKETRAAVQSIKTVWAEVMPGVRIDYTFFEDKYSALYSDDEKTAQLFIIFSMLAIFIACMGLLGLSSFTTLTRTKEIGVRKVLGAGIPTIIFILNRDYIKWIGIAFLAAVPSAVYLIELWLQDFAYRINMSLWVFVLSGGIALVIALATVSFQAIKAATANPVEALRYE